ncbi:hypothetical protein PGN35_009530 [Nodosilinea sp. PGN35]|uniref:hypothetical protein n=1 Tax=Nodosilinea sp. PGN35 TaxID=3020489 RepID=UPI0023B345F9|nr:hypothetical protein [Nodosilinea sp. TSF1-S3]MDF0368483.1 hypothetical protein [Nodosilinea sp. TSF1-S3]
MPGPGLYRAGGPSLGLAIADYRAEKLRLRSPHYRYRPRWIGFGFGIDRIVAAIHQNLGDAVNLLRLTRFGELSFGALGTVALVGAAFDHNH